MPSYTTTAIPPLITNNFGVVRGFDNYYCIDIDIPEAQDLQIQINLLNERVEALEELLLEFGIKKVFDETDNKE